MIRICKWLKPKEEISLFDNGLRIESSLRIFSDSGKWQNRYVVCQRRCLSEAPLIGIFKNCSTREKGEHIELFYIQNYVGYEYGFKYKRSNKTLAILMQGQTLIFSFDQIENMVFWKEWLKDVCGRSAMFFVRVYQAPKDPTIIKLSSKDARIHITRSALVIVQEVPPKQRLYLSLDDLFDVEVMQNRFSFRALTHPGTEAQTFSFSSDQVPELSMKLQYLLKSKQYMNAGHLSARSRGSSLRNGSNYSVTEKHPLNDWSRNSTLQRHSHQHKRHYKGVSQSHSAEGMDPIFSSPHTAAGYSTLQHKQKLMSYENFGSLNCDLLVDTPRSFSPLGRCCSHNCKAASYTNSMCASIQNLRRPPPLTYENTAPHTSISSNSKAEDTESLASPPSKIKKVNSYINESSFMFSVPACSVE